MVRLHTDFNTGANGEHAFVAFLIVCDGMKIVIDIGNLMVRAHIRIAVVHMICNGNFSNAPCYSCIANSFQRSFAVTGKLAVQMIIHRHKIPSFCTIS